MESKSERVDRERPGAVWVGLRAWVYESEGRVWVSYESEVDVCVCVSRCVCVRHESEVDVALVEDVVVRLIRVVHHDARLLHHPPAPVCSIVSSTCKLLV